MSKKFLGLVSGLLLITACSTPGTEETPESANLLKGESVEQAGAQISTWAKLDDKKAIAEVGFTLPLKVVEAAEEGEGAKDYSLKLDFPKEIQEKTVLNHVSVDYAHAGHEPPGVYDLPHYDFHVYMDDQATIAKIDCSDKTLPAEGVIPAQYAILPPDNPGCAPTMGYHAANLTSPELAPENPSKFDKTFILGYYQGKMNFIEPMITTEYLMKKEGYEIKVPKGNPGREGLYPERFKLSFDKAQNAFVFSFSGLK